MLYFQSLNNIVTEIQTLCHTVVAHIQDVVMTSACSSALELSIEVLTMPGQNILVPSPGFGLYTCLGGAHELDCRLYRLLVSGRVGHTPQLLWYMSLSNQNAMK